MLRKLFRRSTPIPRLSDEDLSVWDQLNTIAAVVDRQGEILWTNRAWTRFGIENGMTRKDNVCRNYFEVCEAAAQKQVPGSEAILNGLLRLASELNPKPQRFQHVYPCHAPWEERWYQISASPYLWHEDRVLVIEHHPVQVASPQRVT